MLKMKKYLLVFVIAVLAFGIGGSITAYADDLVNQTIDNTTIAVTERKPADDQGLATAFEKSINNYHLEFTEIEMIAGKARIINDKYFFREVKYNSGNPEHAKLLKNKKIPDPDTLLKWGEKKFKIVIDDQAMLDTTEHPKAKDRAIIEKKLQEIKEQIKDLGVDFTWEFQPGYVTQYPLGQEQIVVFAFDANDWGTVYTPLVRWQGYFSGPIESFETKAHFKSGLGEVYWIGPSGKIFSFVCESHNVSTLVLPEKVEKCMSSTFGLPSAGEREFPELIKSLYSQKMENAATRKQAIKILRTM